MAGRKKHIPAYVRRTARPAVILGIMAISAWLWFDGLARSPFFTPALLEERRYVQRYILEHAPDNAEERMLAYAYWHRYPDVREDGHYGKEGTMGIFGARKHYEQHGRHEGRVYGPLIIPDNLERERKLAEAYWRRYPGIAKSVTWGRESDLGILGPRDHFRYRGREKGYEWGTGTD
jgi:hypothetical protein